MQSTPAGTYYAVRTNKNDLPRRRLLQKLLGYQTSPELNIEELLQDLSLTSETGKVVLSHLQMLQTFDEPVQVDTGRLEGFSHEAAEGLSALSAELASLHEHHNVGSETFTLVIAGLPRLNCHEFLRIVWTLLHTRYAVNYIVADLNPETG